MLEIPFALQWTIPENRLTPLKDSIYQECLYSTSISNIPDFEYFLSIFPNGDTDELRELTRIYLNLELKNLKKIDAKWKVSIEPANCSYSCEYNFEKSVGFGKGICLTEDFFDPEKKFIVDGKCTIKVNGIFKFENENPSTTEIEPKQNWNGGELGDELWEKDETKDFTIVADVKDIKVHKFIMDARSNVFSAMLNPKMKESIESKVEITDFSFDVVETAVKIIYNCNFESSLSFDDQMSLLQFFDKYDLPKLKDKVVQILINQISTSTVCRLTNCSIITNSENLKNICIRFLMAFCASKTLFDDIKILDKDVAFEILQSTLCQIVEIDEDEYEC